MPGRAVEWLPQAALDRMQADLMLQAEQTRAQLAEQVIQDAAPLAAYSIVDLAVSSDDEAIRLRAAMYVLDRELGKPKTTSTINLQADNPVLKLIEGVVVPRGTGEPEAAYADYGYPEDEEEEPAHPGSVVKGATDRGTEQYQATDQYPYNPSATVIDQEGRTEMFAPQYDEDEQEPTE